MAAPSISMILMARTSLISGNTMDMVNMKMELRMLKMQKRLTSFYPAYLSSIPLALIKVFSKASP